MKRLMFFAFSITVCCCAFASERQFKSDIPMILEDHEILFVSQWNTDDQPIVCVITGGNIDSIPTRTLSFYKKSGLESIRLFTFDTPDYPVNMFQTKDSGGQLVTTWTGGSAYHFYVFACIDGNIRKVLEAGSKMVPEFVTDSDGNDIVVISDVISAGHGKNADMKQPLTGTSIFYKWNGKQYEVIRRVRWEKRF